MENKSERLYIFNRKEISKKTNISLNKLQTSFYKKDFSKLSKHYREKILATVMESVEELKSQLKLNRRQN